MIFLILQRYLLNEGKVTAFVLKQIEVYLTFLYVYQHQSTMDFPLGKVKTRENYIFEIIDLLMNRTCILVCLTIQNSKDGLHIRKLNIEKPLINLTNPSSLPANNNFAITWELINGNFHKWKR